MEDMSFAGVFLCKLDEGIVCETCLWEDGNMPVTNLFCTSNPRIAESRGRGTHLSGEISLLLHIRLERTS